jgi:hypothetical protein
MKPDKYYTHLVASNQKYNILKFQNIYTEDGEEYTTTKDNFLLNNPFKGQTNDYTIPMMLENIIDGELYIDGYHEDINFNKLKICLTSNENKVEICNIVGDDYYYTFKKITPGKYKLHIPNENFSCDQKEIIFLPKENNYFSEDINCKVK